MKKLGKLKAAAAALVFSIPAIANDLLWYNGNYDSAGGVDFGQISSPMDDFYVPGAGWYIEEAKTAGVFLDWHNQTVDANEVKVILWQHNPNTDGPDGSATQEIEVTDVDVEVTQETFNDRTIIRLTLALERTFLKGQRYYWIEFRVKNQTGDYFTFLSRTQITHNPGHSHLNPTYSPTNYDLYYSLLGDTIVTIHTMPPEFHLLKADPGKKSHVVYLAGKKQNPRSELTPGFYEMARVNRQIQLYRWDLDGKTKVAFDLGTEPTKHRFHTPLGDELCGDAPDLIMEFCQTFVACAAYEFCPNVDIP